MRKKFQYLRILLKCAPLIIFYHIFYTSRYARHPEKYPLEKRYARIRKEISFVIRSFHLDFNVSNKELFDNTSEKSLIISNHLSFLDPLVLIMLSEKPITFVSKAETFKFPFVGKCVKALEVFPLDRKNLMSQLGTIREVVNYLNDKNKPSVIIFIEGTRSKNPADGCLPFHPGTLKIAQMANVPIITLATYGTFRVLDGKSHLPKYPISFSFMQKFDKDYVKSQNTSIFASYLQNECNLEVNKLKEFDKTYINNLKIKNKIKLLETRFDVSVKS